MKTCVSKSPRRHPEMPYLTNSQRYLVNYRRGIRKPEDIQISEAGIFCESVFCIKARVV